VDAASTVPARRSYSGRSHFLLVLGPPAVGWLASVSFVFLGPYQWWVNYLAAGAVWGLSLPLRNVVRAAFMYSTHQFRDASQFSWWYCVKSEALGEVSDFCHQPLGHMMAWAGVTIVDIFLWPVMVYLGATLKGTLDYG
jgi:hypothetical protein